MFRFYHLALAPFAFAGAAMLGGCEASPEPAAAPALSPSPSQSPGPTQNTSETQQASLAEFAKAQLNALQPVSFAQGREHCGVIYKTADGELRATETFTGSRAGCSYSFTPKRGEKALATFHTHGAHSDDNGGETPSPADLADDIRNRLTGFVATPGGRVWRNDWREQSTQQLCGLGCVAADPSFKVCDAFAPKPAYSLAQLIERFSDKPEAC
jgi:hypothetical protein